jgi:hypothetical protein
LYLALVEDGAVLDVEPQKIEIPDQLQSSSTLTSFRTEVDHQLALASPKAVAILLPNNYGGAAKPTTARLAAETVVRLAAHDRKVEVALLTRSKARSVMQLGSGELENVLKAFLPTPVGKYWGVGRRHASLAALARARMAA